MATNRNPEVWKNVQVDVQSALATAKTLSDISNASPGVASSTGHGYTNGDYLLLAIEGMDQIDNVVVRVSASTTDSFSLEGVDTTLMGGFISGTAQKITFGTSAKTFTDVNPTGGEPNKVLIDTIHRDQAYNIPAGFSPLTYGMGSLWLPDDPALNALRAFYADAEFCCIRFRFKSGRKMVFAGYPSANLAPGGSAGGAVTTPISIDVLGALQFYPT